MDLNVIETGGGRPLVILHGLLGTARNWGMISKELGRSWRVFAVDMPNHGASPWSERMDYPFMAQEVGDWIARHCPGAVVMGHSMGGKAAMTLALTRPELVSRLIVVDIAPVTYTHGFTGYTRAMRAVPLDRAVKRSDVEEHLARTIDNPRIRAFLMQNLDSGPDGYRWRANIDVLERDMAGIVGFPSSFPHAAYDGPTLFVSGGDSEYIRPQDTSRIMALFPQARMVTVSGAGHWLHADKPREFLDVVTAFLEREA